MAYLRLREVVKSYDGKSNAVDDISIDIDARRVRHVPGSERLRQDHDLMMIAGFEYPTSGAIELDGHDLVPEQALRAQHRHGVPELCAVPAHDGGEERGVSAQDAGLSRSRRSRRAPSACSSWWACAVRRPLSARAVRRPAAAGGAGARPRVQPRRAPARRAARRARQEPARADAGRAQAHSSRGRDHHDLRHPRPDRGDDDVGPRGGVLQRQGRAGRHAARGLQPAGQPLRRRVHRRQQLFCRADRRGAPRSGRACRHRSGARRAKGPRRPSRPATST